MRVDSTFRVMWLLNHSSARKFEIPMMKKIGIKEIFTPKITPEDISFRSDSVSYEEDDYLTIPDIDLKCLNEVNWYEGATKSDWELANKYFDVCFFILHDKKVFDALKYFDGILLWRAYGLDKSLTYTKVLENFLPKIGIKKIKQIGDRFVFATAYEHLHIIEDYAIAKKAMYLPLGMSNIEIRDEWLGKSGRIFFVCPDIGFNPYYKNIYDLFVESFEKFDYYIGGAQPIKVDDPNVLGFVSDYEHKENMRNMSLMFYHSQEPNHIHYHPFEAVRAGMPLIFMANGLLDSLGGRNLPGRCITLKDAQKKITRILNDDKEFIEEIRSTQKILLEAMNPAKLLSYWREGFEIIKDKITNNKEQIRYRPISSKPNRIAVIVPIGYRGGSLRGAKLLAQSLQIGAEQSGKSAELVLLHLDDPVRYPSKEFEDLPSTIKIRSFKWRTLNADEARRAMRYSGHGHWEPTASEYVVVDDGIKQLEDCDLWVMVSDRITAPLLPLRPVVHMVFDYLQRYLPILPHGADQPFINATRAAAQVWTTTEFTRQDALQYAGIDAKRVVKLPMLAPAFKAKQFAHLSKHAPYFVWTTNEAPHKNHEHALRALQLYYDELNGTLDCHVTGVNTHNLLKTPPEQLKQTMAWVRAHVQLKRRLHWPGELPDTDYQRLLQGASFLWHAGYIDNGTFSVVEAAGLGVPALSSDYPAMREMDAQFALNLSWMDASDPKAMAQALKDIEQNHRERRALLPTADQLASQSIDRLAPAYWKAASACL